MKSWFLFATRVTTAIVLSTAALHSARAQIIYSNGFDGPVGPEWSLTTTSVTPVGGRTFLGEFGNQTAVLTLSSLPAHTSVTVSFDLFIIQTWDGNDTSAGPDIWDLSVAGGPTLLHTTFQNPHNLFASSGQAYPDMYPGGQHPSGTGAAEINTLGYVDQGPLHLGPMDMVYELKFTFADADSVLALDFSASDLEASNEYWGIDNVVVTIPEPSSLALAIVGVTTVGLGLRRPRKVRSSRSQV
jgi:hypothetical protein